MPRSTYLTPAQVSRKITLHAKKPRISAPFGVKLPSQFSLRDKCPIPYDQGQIGSCTANAFCGAYKLLSGNTWEPSRRYFYYYERLAEDPNHNPADLTDSGGDVEDGAQFVEQNGICSEALCPYDPANINTPPSAEADADASQHKIQSYANIPIDNKLLTTIKHSLTTGNPVLIGIQVYNSFESSKTAQTGIVTLPHPVRYGDPNDSRDPYMGGHEMLCVGYDDHKKLVTVLNSWGSSWGDGGFCYIPYSYLTNKNLAIEFATITLPSQK
jgi:C1A family cysteine protease